MKMLKDNKCSRIKTYVDTYYKCNVIVVDMSYM